MYNLKSGRATTEQTFKSIYTLNVDYIKGGILLWAQDSFKMPSALDRRSSAMRLYVYLYILILLRSAVHVI